MVYLGPSPSEVFDLLAAERVQMIRGNADDIVTGVLPPEVPPNPKVAEILAEHVTWNRRHLRPNQLDLLKGLPLTLRFGSLLVCHAAPDSNHSLLPRLDQHTRADLEQIYSPSSSTGSTTTWRPNSSGCGTVLCPSPPGPSFRATFRPLYSSRSRTGTGAR